MARLIYTSLFAVVASLVTTQFAQAQQGPRPWYFGMNVSLAELPGYGRVLRVNSVTPGGPAQRAGLEYGDHIYMVNNARFDWANSNCDAINILQRATGSAPGGGGIETRVVTRPGTARMQVVDIRTGQLTPVVCYPHFNGGVPTGGGVPTAAVVDPIPRNGFPTAPGRPTSNIPRSR